MSKILIFPDIHGRTFWKNIDIKPYDYVIFLGDYFDHYPDEEGITAESTIENFKEIIQFQKENSDKVTLLLGNHDLHYIDGSLWGCRKDYDNAREIEDLIYSVPYQICKIIDNVIFTHAGIHVDWLKAMELNNAHPNEINIFINSLDLKYFNIISRYRGGYNNFGSCTWADVREYIDLNKLYGGKEGYIQIFSHTRLEPGIIIIYDQNIKGFNVIENSDIPQSPFYMIDCQKPFVFDTETQLLFAL